MVLFRRLVVFVCLLAVSCYGKTPRKAADVPVKLSDGKTIHLTQYRGKVVMVVMFLTTCPECVETIKFLGRLQTQLDPKYFQPIAISLDPDPKVVAPFVQRYRPTFPVGHLDKDAAIKLGDMTADARPIVPVIIYIDWMGNVRFQYYGNDAIFQQAPKNISTIAGGLVKQAIERTGPKYATRPANQAQQPPQQAKP